MSLHRIANLVIGRTDSCMRHTLPSFLSPTRVFVLLSMLSSEIYLRLKPYLVVKITSHKVTEHCYQLCVLSMLFCRSDCRLCDGTCDCAMRKFLRVLRGLTSLRQANMGYEKYS